VLTVFGLAVVQSATAIAMVELDAGREATALGAYRKSLSRLGSLVGAVLVSALVVGIFGLTGIGVLISIWLLVRWALFAQATALEDASALGALRRSGRLVQGNWWHVGSLMLFVTVIALLLGPLCGTLLLFVTHASFDFINLVSSVVYAVVLPFAAIATTYLYFDLRVAKQHEAKAAEAGEVLPVEVPPVAAPQ
jgi:hypothetical protein